MDIQTRIKRLHCILEHYPHWHYKYIEAQEQLSLLSSPPLSSPPLTPHGGESDSAMRQEEHREFVQAMQEKNDLHTMGMGG